MKATYNYVIHAYEDVRWTRPINHQHGGTTVLNDGASALGRVEELAMDRNLPGRLQGQVGRFFEDRYVAETVVGTALGLRAA
jgi:hypothetical protein